MDFGLGLVLSFTDNASGGIQNAVDTLNQLTQTASNATNSLTGMAQLGAFSVVADRMGSSFLQAGTGILSMFTNILGKVQQTGSEFENFRMTLTALYGGGVAGAEEAEKQISKLLDFSIKSPFEVGDVKDMLVVLKSQGIDAFSQMSNAANDFQQENLAWIADLMAFKPDIPTERWKLAITNFLGSGEAKVLRNALDMGNIEQILGHAIGDTAEERMQDLREIVEKAGITGLADNLSNTWQGVASNIDDAFTKLYKSVADNGVFEKLKGSFMGVAGAIMQLDNEELEALGKTLADGLNIIVTPVTVVAEKVNLLIGKLVELCQTNPELVKWGMVVVAVIGGLLVLGGVVLKFSSALGMLTIGLSQFGNAFNAVGSLLRSGSLKMIGALLPLTLTIGLIYLAWKSDFGGIRTMLTDFVVNLRSSFATARQATQLGVGGMMQIVNQLQAKGDFWSNFTVGLIKVKTSWDILKDAWSDYTISDELYEKMVALGLKPLVEAILDFKWRFDHFKEGFIEGWNTIGNFVKGVLTSITNTFKGTFLESMIDGVTRFFQALSNNDPEEWRKVGVVVGEIAAVILPLVSAMKMFNRVTSLGGILPRLFGGRGGNDGGSGGAGGAGGNGILSSPSKALKMLGSMVILIGGVVAVIEVIGMLSRNPYFMTFLDSGTKTMTKLAGSMLSVAAVVGVLGILTATLSSMGVSPNKALKSMADMAILIGGLDIIITAIGALNTIPYFSEFLGTGVSILDALSKSLLDVASISLVLGVVCAVFSGLKLSPKEAALGMANVAIILGGLDVLITAIGALNNIPYFAQFLADGVGIMSTLMVVLKSMFDPGVIITIGLISAFGLVPVSAVALGLANLAIVLGGITVLIEAFGALSLIPGFNDFLERGGDTLALLFGQLGKIAGSVIGGIAEGITEGLPGIGENLAEFGQNIQPFFDAVSDAPLDEVARFASALGTFMLKMGANEVLSFITGGVDLPALGKQLSDFGESVKPFFESMVDVPEAGLEKAPKVIQMICSIGGYGIKTGGLAQLFTGETDLRSIGQQLADFAPNGETFFSDVANYSDKGIEKAPKALKAIVGIGNYNFKSGGVAQFFTGDTSISKIGEQLADFAPNGTTFFNEVANYSEAGLTKAPKVFKAIAGIGDYDFKSGGLAQLFTGGTNLGKIGEQLTDFGTEAQGFFDIAAQISDKGLKNGEKVVGTVERLGQFKTGGLVELFTGSLDLVEIGEQLADFSGNIKGYFDTAATLTDKGLTNGERVFSALSAIGNMEFRSGGVVQFFTGNVSLSSIGTELSNFATNGKTFFDTAAQIDVKGFSNARSMFSSLGTMGDVVDFAVKSNGSLSKFGNELVSFVNDVETFVNKAGQLGDMSGIGTLTDALQTLSDKFTEVKGGISDGSSSIITSLTDMSNKSKDTASAYVGDMDTMLNKQTTVYSQMQSATSTTFQALYTTIDTQMQSAVSAVQTAVNTMKSAMNFQWSLPDLKVPHVNVTGSFNLNPPSAPNFSVNWYAKGGVFEQPNIIGVGEAGKEAVMPLENNTGWINDLSLMISKNIEDIENRKFIPVNGNGNVTNTSSFSEDRYMTSNVTNNTNTAGDTDNSVTFEEGSIVVQCMNASEEEAIRLAKIIMEYINRQKQLDKMLSYS